jgi:dolichyl-phosphate-mannose-protein mannosyltransferase
MPQASLTDRQSRIDSSTAATGRIAESFRRRPSDPTITPVTRDRWCVPYAGALTVVLTGLWLWAARREGSLEQNPPWDNAWFHLLAIEIKRAMESRGIAGLVEAWVSTSGTHAPLVPTLSAFLMALFGESRAVAESILPLASFVLILSVFRATERLYGRASAYAVSALTVCFPLSLKLSRTFLLEHPFAALFAAACWALLASEGFRRVVPTVAFGVLCGLTSVSRLGGPVLLVGPTLVALAVAMRSPGRLRAAAGLLVATAIGGGIAATWYVPNWDKLRDYLHRVTYGSHATVYAGGGSGITWENARYYLHWNVLDGPGWPLVAVAVVAFGIGALARRGRSLLSPVMLACAAAFAIDFTLLLLAYQQVGAVLFLPVMPILAVAIVRAIAFVPSVVWRRTLGAIAGALAVVHVVSVTFVFDVPTRPLSGYGPFPRVLRLWNHHIDFLDFAGTVGAASGTDFRMGPIAERLETLSLPLHARICFLADHPFFNVHALNLEVRRRRHPWKFLAVEPVKAGGKSDWRYTFRQMASASEALVVREGGRHYLKAHDSFDPVAAIATGPLPWFERAGEPLPLGDGSKAVVYHRLPRVEVRAELPPYFQPTPARFGEKGLAEGLELEAAAFAWNDCLPILALSFRCATPPPQTPSLFAHVKERDKVAFLSARDFPPAPVPAPATPFPEPCHVIVRLWLHEMMPPLLPQRGFKIGIGVFAGDGPFRSISLGPRRASEQFSIVDLLWIDTRSPVRRLPAWSQLPSDEGGTRLYVWDDPGSPR